MNMLTRKSVVLYLAAVFAAGLLAGGTGGFSLGKRKAFAPPRQEEMAGQICGRLKSRLGLTQDQMKEIQPILNETAAELASVHAATAERISEIIQKSNRRLAQFLTPEQKLLLEEMERERQDFVRKACKPPPGAPGSWPLRNTN